MSTGSYDATTGVAMVRSRFSDQHMLALLTCGAILLRLVLFLGRGAYVAFDEGWYLLLGRSVFSGDGYTLTGLQHTTLSPLFPLLAGAVWKVIGNPVWAGRLVAALAAGALVWPCWHIFRRLADRRTAWLACVLVAVMPALAPFVAAYWIGWDLWVGAEPVLHFFLFSGIALVLRARERARASDWLLAGAAFALAYLARPEAVIPFGVIGLLIGVDALRRRSRTLLVHAAVFGLAFAVTATPYWLYLHDVLGRWALTGRAVEMPTLAVGSNSGPRARGSAMIEGMLWGENETPYVRALYSLDASGTRLRASYWGVPRKGSAEAVVTPRSDPAETREPARSENVAPPTERVTSPIAAPRSRLALYAAALGRLAPWFIWLLAAIGIAGRARPWRRELFVALPLACASFAIARVVAIDPRTQLFLLPLIAFYAARGIHAAAAFIDARVTGVQLRRGFARAALASIVIALLLTTEARWLYMSLSLGSPHHLVGAANQEVGAALHELIPPSHPVMSWHPAIALYADRDWRALPYARFDEIVRYAHANDIEHIILSVYYPAPQLLEDMPRAYLVVQVPPDTRAAGQWHLELSPPEESYLFGRLRSAP